MNTNRAAAEFDAVHHDVVMLAANFFRVGLEQRDVLRHGRGERMMAGIPAVLFLIETEQREIDDPQEIESIGGDGQLALRFQDVRAIETDLAENFAGVEPLIGGEQNQIAFFDFQVFESAPAFSASLKNFTMGDFHSPPSTLM